MDEFDEPIQFELRTEREVATLMYALGMGSADLLQTGNVQGMVALSNLQKRLASADPQLVEESLSEYGDGGVLTGEGEMSESAAVAGLVDDEEADPDEVIEGMI